MYKKTAEQTKATVAVAAAEDPNVLEAIVDAQEIALFTLVGDKEKILKEAEDLKLDISPCEIINEPDPINACKVAVNLVAADKAQALMKGLIDTSVIMKAVLDKDAGMHTSRKLSHLAVFEVPAYHKLLFVTDAAINIAPDINEQQEIIQNAIDAVKSLGISLPKVALLAAKEKADPKMPATMDAAQLTNRFRKGEITGCILDGPLALDNAVSAESIKIKGIKSPVGGDADILVCPNIEAGIILYKTLAFLGNAKVGGVVLGAKRPVILTSRADSAESKRISIALGILS